jgi:hypothetical protein
MALKRAKLMGFLPWRFIVKRKNPFNIMACQLSIVTSPRIKGNRPSFQRLFLPRNYALRPTKAGSR